MESARAHAPLSGKIAVVTGGSSGIGAACVRALAEAGATLVIGFNAGQERAEALRSALAGTGHVTLRMPLADHVAHAAAASQIEARFGRVDVLVNSAGFT